MIGPTTPHTTPTDQPEIEVTDPTGETVTTCRSVEAQFDGAMDVVCRWDGGDRRSSVEP